MKNKICFWSSLLVVIFLSGCAFGPLVNHESARSVGKSNHEIMGSVGSPGYAFKWTYGATENLDLGVQWESLSLGIRAKYSFLNQTEGWSFAGALGTGASTGGSHNYGDLISSYASGAWEPYGTLRAVHVTTDPMDFRNADTGNLVFTVDRSQYTYGQFFLGTRYWFNPNWLMSAEASWLFSITPGIVFSGAPLLSINLGYRL